MTGPYRILAACLPKSHATLVLLVRLVLDHKLAVRREMLKATRVRSNPLRNSFLALQSPLLLRASRLRNLCYPTTTTPDTYSLEEYLDLLHEYVWSSDIISSFYSMYIRNLPFGYQYQDEENHARIQSFLKEFRASQEINTGGDIDYRSIFDDPSIPWHSSTPHRESLNRDVNQKLRLWKSTISRRVLLPKVSKKSMGFRSSTQLYTALHDSVSNVHKMSTADYEKYYHQTGHQLEGPAEMRQAFFFTDLTPRTYYAQGLTTYNASKYVQQVFNSLQDAFPNTHRFRRFSMSRLRIDPWDVVIVYDYTSFTSKMKEQRRFLDALAAFCQDTFVTILDTHVGLIHVNLGALLQEYNETCNVFPEFEIADALRDLVGFSDEIYAHQCAGFLGVHGNLASCTVLHGLHLVQITGSYDRCSCVGDDALGIMEITVAQDKEEGEIVPLDSVHLTLDAIRTIGEIQREKTRVFDPITEDEHDDHRWAYLKRSLDRIEDQLVLGEMLSPPSFAMVFHEFCHTTRRLRFDLSPENVCSRFASQAFSFVRRLHELSGIVTEEDVEVAWTYLRHCYSHLKLPLSGYLFGKHNTGVPKHLEDVTLLPFLPRNQEDCMELVRKSPIVALSEMLLDAEVWLPECVLDRVVASDVDLEPSEQFTSTGNGVLSLLELFGYVTRSTPLVKVDKGDILDRLTLFLNRRSRILYVYTVERSLPSWGSNAYHAVM